jgi:hypothetical protein
MEGNPFANESPHGLVAKGTLALSREAENGCLSHSLVAQQNPISAQGQELRPGNCCTCLLTKTSLSKNDRSSEK